jgi:hypothetical protein
MAAKIVAFTQKGNKFLATVDGGPPFYVASKVVYKNPQSGMETWGLINLSTSGPLYDPASIRPQEGIWADFIYPICLCESQASFQCLNTYDVAYFTFGFLQFAAHVPNGDFVTFLRALLALPLGPSYFPDLAVQGGRIVRVTDTGVVPLESDSSTRPLMEYLNPSLSAIEDIEIINAAKFVHWSLNEEDHRTTQVELGIAHIRGAMAGYASRYALDQAIDKVCLVVTDIRHQGRAKSSQIIEALNTGGDQDAAYNNLLQIGLPWFEPRIKTLKKAIATLVSDGRLGTTKYDIASGDFVPL